MNTTDLTLLPARPSLEQYKKQAKDFVKAHAAGEPGFAERTRKFHPHPPSGRLALTDAQLVLAREHGFESWPKFASYLEALHQRDSPTSQFEQAADAIVTGDTRTLRRLLRANPALIHLRSPRVHRATLLDYVGANGFENYRQKTPKNAVEIAQLLLDAGAEVDARSDMYGHSTVLGLVATSVHPKQAGVQIPLLEVLLNAGASLEGAPDGWNPLTAALANGRGEAAQFLADRGAKLDLEGAAGVGYLDAVKSFFRADGGLKPSATRRQMDRGFVWACEYGRSEVVDFLIDCGASLTEQAETSLNGLHWAIVGGQHETVRLLLRRGADLEDRNEFGGTALGCAFWCLYNGHPALDHRATIRLLLEAGANADDSPLLREVVDKFLASTSKRMNTELKLRIVLEKPPAGVDYGLQKGRGNDYETVQTQRSTGKDLLFECVVGVKTAKTGGPDFAGPFVQGPASGRFLYLDIGTYAGQTETPWSRRLKIPLSEISPAAVFEGRTLETRVPGTGKDGGPNCATVKPFAGWKPVTSSERKS